MNKILKNIIRLAPFLTLGYTSVFGQSAVDPELAELRRKYDGGGFLVKGASYPLTLVSKMD